MTIENIPSPADVLGYPMGTARKLPDWPEMLEYFEQLAAASDRVELEQLGESTDGHPYVIVTISSPANLARRQELRDMLGQLYDPRNLSPDDEARLIENAKVCAFLLCTQHSNEIGAALMTLELAHEFARRDDPEMHEILDNVVTVIIPTHNPDGHVMTIDWYRKWLDTPYEGQHMPWLYHRYVGHDNNRDWFMLTQKETRLYAWLHNRERPQLVFDMHQMNRDGARFMVPPFIDPLDPNQDPVIQQGFADLGTAIATRLTAAGKAGVATNIMFDNYSPSLAYGNYHGSVDLLSEAASVRLATPVTVDEDDFSLERDFDPRKRTWNHPLPWKGGEWTLAEIVDYDRLAALAFIEHAARNRRQWLRNYVGVMRRTAQPEADAKPYAFIIPRQQDDPGTAWELLETLHLGDVAIEEASTEFTAEGITWPAGSWVIRMAQPSGKFVKTLLELQEYPELRRWPEGPPIPPYDIAGHTLPLQMGVRAVQVDEPFEVELSYADVARPVGTVAGDGKYGWSLNPRENWSTRLANTLVNAGMKVYRLPAAEQGLPVGTFIVPVQPGAADALAQGAAEIGVNVASLERGGVIEAVPYSLPRIGVYQSWDPSIDEGWIRWIFEEYGFPYEVFHDADAKQGDLNERFDTIIIPQHPAEKLLNGNPEKNKYKEPYPPEYVGGLGSLGMEGLRQFAERGGTLVALDTACNAIIDHLYLPVTNVVAGLKPTDFYCPGSLLRVLIDTRHPLGYGLRRGEVALFMRSPVFQAAGGAGVTVVGSYPMHNPNLSGWILGHEKLVGKSALLEVPLEDGLVILIGFRPQFRAQSRGTYKVLFNAVTRNRAAKESIQLG